MTESPLAHLDRAWRPIQTDIGHAHVCAHPETCLVCLLAAHRPIPAEALLPRPSWSERRVLVWYRQLPTSVQPMVEGLLRRLVVAYTREAEGRQRPVER